MNIDNELADRAEIVFHLMRREFAKRDVRR